MRELKAGDRFLAHLVARRRYLLLAQAALLATALAAVWLRVVKGEAGQVLPWQGGILSLYGFGMAACSGDRRSVVVWSAFGLLVAAAFLPVAAAGPALTGGAQALCALAIAFLLRALSADPRFSGGMAVLESRDSPP